MSTRQQVIELLQLAQADATQAEQAGRALRWYEATCRTVVSSGATAERKKADVEAAHAVLANMLRNIIQPVTDDPVTGVRVAGDASSS